ncbi:hypothetical protein ACIRU3_40525 [Streptomyces sp. NPDC101151]|uniref:hypothetical protein n=1 Tax=Streptomyces sp. NPDC101151 TaxID=3366115 RepID=UPI0038158551
MRQIARSIDLPNGRNGKAAAGEHVFVVTHEPSADREHGGTTPFTFVNGVEVPISSARNYADDRIVHGWVSRYSQ